MSAFILERLRDSGINVAVEGDRLRIDAPFGVLTPNLKAWLVECKTDVLAEVRTAEGRSRLIPLAVAEMINIERVYALADEDAAACGSLPDSTLIAFIRALRDSELREHGKRPIDETEPALCRCCGLICVAPEVADVAPIINRIPTIVGCPWCHVKSRETIPRPQVICGSCSHFTRDVINPFQGMGHCIVGCDPDYGYPAVKRTCASWRPIAS